MTRHAFSSDKLAPAVGPFSPAVRAGEFLFLSGQVAQDPTDGKLIAGDVSAQAEQIFRNLGALLHAADKSLTDVIRVGVYLTDMKDFARMNAVYERHFEAPYPARTTVAVSALPLGAAIEIEVIAH